MRKGVLDCGVIGFDEVAFAIPDSKRGFTCAVIVSTRVAVHATNLNIPTLLEPKIAIFLCLTDGAIVSCVRCRTVRTDSGGTIGGST